MREIDFFDLVPGSEQVEEDRLVHSLLAEFEMVPVNRRFGAVVRWYIEPGASGSENVQDAIEQPAGVTPRATNVRLRWWEVFLDNPPEIIVNFPENHDPRFYLRYLIILGSSLTQLESGKLPRRCTDPVFVSGRYARVQIGLLFCLAVKSCTSCLPTLRRSGCRILPITHTFPLRGARDGQPNLQQRGCSLFL